MLFIASFFLGTMYTLIPNYCQLCLKMEVIQLLNSYLVLPYLGGGRIPIHSTVFDLKQLSVQNVHHYRNLVCQVAGLVGGFYHNLWYQLPIVGVFIVQWS